MDECLVLATGCEEAVGVGGAVGGSGAEAVHSSHVAIGFPRVAGNVVGARETIFHHSGVSTV